MFPNLFAIGIFVSAFTPGVLDGDALESCRNADKAVTQNHSIMDELIELKKEYDNSKRLMDNPARLFTSKVAYKLQNDMIVISTMHQIENKFGGDDLFANYFLQGKSDLPQSVGEFDAEILYLKDALIINPLNDSEVLIMAISDYDISNIANRIESSKIKNKVDELYGFGLGEFGTPESFIGTPTCKCKADGTSEVCDSGGVGSGECSLTQGTNTCTVSCSLGYYACCKYGQ